MKKHILTALLVSMVFVLSVGAPAMAEEEGFMPELFLVDPAYAPEQGEFGVWLQPQYYSDDEGTLTVVNLAVEYGLTDQLLLEASYEAYKKIDPEDDLIPSESGTGDTTIGVLYALSDEGATTHFAVGLEVLFPTGDEDKGLTEDETVYEPYLAVSHDLASGASLHANLSYGIVKAEEEAPGVPAEEEDEVGIAVAYVHPLDESLALMVEAAMESNEWLADGEETEGLAGVGVAWQNESGLQVGAGFFMGTTEDSPDWAVMFNIGMEFEAGGGDDD